MRLLEVEFDLNRIFVVRETRVARIAIPSANSTAFGNVRMRNNHVHRICHFRFPEIFMMYIDIVYIPQAAGWCTIFDGFRLTRRLIAKCQGFQLAKIFSSVGMSNLLEYNLSD